MVDQESRSNAVSPIVVSCRVGLGVWRYPGPLPCSQPANISKTHQISREITHGKLTPALLQQCFKTGSSRTIRASTLPTQKGPVLKPSLIRGVRHGAVGPGGLFADHVEGSVVPRAVSEVDVDCYWRRVLPPIQRARGGGGVCVGFRNHPRISSTFEADYATSRTAALVLTVRLPENRVLLVLCLLSGSARRYGQCSQKFGSI